MPTNDTIHYVHTNLYSDKAKEVMDSVFGQLFDGFDVLDAIASVDTDRNDAPLQDVVMESVTIEKFA